MWAMFAIVRFQHWPSWINAQAKPLLQLTTMYHDDQIANECSQLIECFQSSVENRPRKRRKLHIAHTAWPPDICDVTENVKQNSKVNLCLLVGALPANLPSQRCDYFDIKGCWQTMEQRRIEVLLHQGRCGKNSQRKLWQLSKLLIFLTAALFTLRTFGAEITWRVRGKVLFDPHRFLSNKSPIHFAVTSRNANKISYSKPACSIWK